jgi:hypothetical protein
MEIELRIFASLLPLVVTFISRNNRKQWNKVLYPEMGVFATVSPAFSQEKTGQTNLGHGGLTVPAVAVIINL